MLTYFVFIFFLLFAFYGVIRRKWMAGVFIVIIYALSSFCSILLLNTDPSFYKPTALPTIIYCAFLFVTLKPFLRQKPIIEGFSSNTEKNRFIIIGYALSIAVIFGMIIILPRITVALEYGLVETRTEMYQGELANIANAGLLMKTGSRIVGYLGAIWYLYIIMFFYAVVFVKGKLLLKILLIVASLSQVEFGLTIGGRTNAIYWLLSFLFTLILFNTYLNHKTKKIAIATSLIFMIIVIVYVAFVTYQRGLYREGGVNGFLLAYIGEPFLFFCEYFDKVDWHPYTLERIFPFSSNVIGTGFNLGNYRTIIDNHSGLSMGVFYTFMGDIFVDIGLLGLLLFVLIYYKVSKVVLRPKVFKLKDLFYLSIIYVIPLHGLFFYSFWKSGDFCVLITILIAKYVTTGVRSNSTLKVYSINHYK